MGFEIKFMPLLSPLECFYAYLGTILGTYVLSLTHLVLNTKSFLNLWNLLRLVKDKKKKKKN